MTPRTRRFLSGAIAAAALWLSVPAAQGQTVPCIDGVPCPFSSTTTTTAPATTTTTSRATTTTDLSSSETPTTSIVDPLVPAIFDSSVVDTTSTTGISQNERVADAPLASRASAPSKAKPWTLRGKLQLALGIPLLLAFVIFGEVRDAQRHAAITAEQISLRKEPTA
jgi:hypothetical protein